MLALPKERVQWTRRGELASVLFRERRACFKPLNWLHPLLTVRGPRRAAPQRPTHVAVRDSHFFEGFAENLVSEPGVETHRLLSGMERHRAKAPPGHLCLQCPNQPLADASLPSRWLNRHLKESAGVFPFGVKEDAAHNLGCFQGDEVQTFFLEGETRGLPGVPERGAQHAPSQVQLGFV
jgi:hypothetical protein